DLLPERYATGGHVRRWSGERLLPGTGHVERRSALPTAGHGAGPDRPRRSGTRRARPRASARVVRGRRAHRTVLSPVPSVRPERGGVHVPLTNPVARSAGTPRHGHTTRRCPTVESRFRSPGSAAVR